MKDSGALSNNYGRQSEEEFYRCLESKGFVEKIYCYPSWIIMTMDLSPGEKIYTKQVRFTLANSQMTKPKNFIIDAVSVESRDGIPHVTFYEVKSLYAGGTVQQKLPFNILLFDEMSQSLNSYDDCTFSFKLVLLKMLDFSVSYKTKVDVYKNIVKSPLISKLDLELLDIMLKKQLKLVGNPKIEILNFFDFMTKNVAS